MSYYRSTYKTPFVSHQIPDDASSKADITPTKKKYNRVTIRYGGAPHHLPVSQEVDKPLETKREDNG